MRPSSTPLCQRLAAIMTRWLRLIQITCNPYRPELHYMRGAGPKWHAKHTGGKLRTKQPGGDAVSSPSAAEEESCRIGIRAMSGTSPSSDS
jgi:hypothetical protein